MPTIPRYPDSPTVAAAPLQPPLIRGASLAAQQVEAVGRQLLYSGRLAIEVGIQNKIRAENTAEMEAGNTLREASSRILADIFEAKGEHADPARQKGLAEFEETLQGVLAKLPNDRVRHDWMLRTGRDVALNTDLRSRRHVEEQNEIRAQAAFDTSKATIRSQALGAGDDLDFGVQVNKGKKEIRRYGDAQGKTAEEIDREVDEWESATVKDRITAMIASDHAIAAKTFFDKVKDGILPEYRAAIDKLLEPATDREQGIIDNRKLFQEVGLIDDQGRTVDDYTPEQHDLVYEKLEAITGTEREGRINDADAFFRRIRTTNDLRVEATIEAMFAELQRGDSIEKIQANAERWRFIGTAGQNAVVAEAVRVHKGLMPTTNETMIYKMFEREPVFDDTGQVIGDKAASDQWKANFPVLLLRNYADDARLKQITNDSNEARRRVQAGEARGGPAVGGIEGRLNDFLKVWQADTKVELDDDDLGYWRTRVRQEAERRMTTPDGKERQLSGKEMDEIIAESAKAMIVRDKPGLTRTTAAALLPFLPQGARRGALWWIERGMGGEERPAALVPRTVGDADLGRLEVRSSDLDEFEVKLAESFIRERDGLEPGDAVSPTEVRRVWAQEILDPNRPLEKHLSKVAQETSTPRAPDDPTMPPPERVEEIDDLIRSRNMVPTDQLRAKTWAKYKALQAERTLEGQTGEAPPEDSPYAWMLRELLRRTFEGGP